MKRHYYITGVDGIGKTTQVDILEKRLSDILTRRVWLRFPILFSLPLVIYARLFGFTRYETFDGVRVGAWEFHRSALLRTIFPYTQYLDTLLLGCLKTLPPRLTGKTLLIERYSLDVLVDTMVATRQYSLYHHRLGMLFLRLIPRDTLVVVMDAPVDAVRMRRADLTHDPLIVERSRTYRAVAEHYGFRIVDGGQPVGLVEREIQRALTL